MSHSAQYPEMTHEQYVEHLKESAYWWSAVLGDTQVAEHLKAKARRISNPKDCPVCREGSAFR